MHEHVLFYHTIKLAKNTGPDRSAQNALANLHNVFAKHKTDFLSSLNSQTAFYLKMGNFVASLAETPFSEYHVSHFS